MVMGIQYYTHHYLYPLPKGLVKHRQIFKIGPYVPAMSSVGELKRAAIGPRLPSPHMDPQGPQATFRDLPPTTQ